MVCKIIKIFAEAEYKMKEAYRILIHVENLLITIYFTVKSILNIKKNIEVSKKMLKHISDSGTLGLALGVMGAFLGLISAFDVLEATGAAAPSVVAGGIKVALLSPLFGLFTFCFSKLSMLILRIIQK